MALDGVVISDIVYELGNMLSDARISKIAQPERDALLLTCKTGAGNQKLFISVNPSLPYVCITEKSYQAPLTAPSFCMSLRKHIANGRITGVEQPDFERIIRFEIEHTDELGDRGKKYLIVELMGKHSNIIFTDASSKVIDAIRHVGPTKSSVRMVLPGSEYFVAGQNDKKNPLTDITEEEFSKIMRETDTIERALYLGFTGISPLVANELCHRASVDSGENPKSLKDAELHRLYVQFVRCMDMVRSHDYHPNIVSNRKKPVEFSVMELTSYSKHYEREEFDSVSAMLERYYYDLNVYTKVRSRSADMRKLLTQISERDTKKLSLMKKQFKDTENMEKYRLFGELIRAYAYSIPKGEKSCEVYDYNSDENVTIPLKPELSPIENANVYFQKYNKQKRTRTALTTQIAEVEREIDYIASVLMSIDISVSEEDLKGIREELYESGLVKKRGPKEKVKTGSDPLHFRSSDGFDIFVGKNNNQNEFVTFKLAGNSDLWFHAKKIPGCHVIVKTQGKELPDQTYEEAAMLAAFYSSGRSEGKLAVDYVKRGELKKPPGAAKGYVIYHTNYSMVVEPKIPEGVEEVL